ncbi:hypothetical protein E1267_24400 [Nonomuraea longispora]|uniref:Uncharacterized protein n=1 Tax=Nonomuraea longispora TaxID=1848320 RepID=A0A4R4NBK9_9ACTN|nr:hypothetical protein [Nonomuraea longispora]TDC03982.1 hypothetical protein E1267_24400 [Nonomuraea longispora]
MTRNVPTPWTRRLQLLTAAASALFAVGTALQTFLIIDLEMIRHSMRLAGLSAAEAAGAAPGLLTFLRGVGVAFIAGNALGLLAPRGWTWVFWVVLAVNLGQAAGPFGMIPPEVYEASLDLYGPAGLLPTVVTDGGAAILVIVLLVSLAVFRRPWACSPYETGR